MAIAQPDILPTADALGLEAVNPYLAQQGFVEIDPMPLAPFVPQTTAWAVLFAVLLVLCGCAAGLHYRRWRRNAYRREAIAAIRAVRHSPREAFRLAKVVKSVALTSYGREAVARLSGREWLAFIDRTHRHRFDPLPESLEGSLLLALSYRPDAAQECTAPRLHSLCEYLEHWVAHHVPEASDCV